MGDPVTASAAFAFLNSTFKFAEFAIKVCGVETENGVFVRMIQRVRLDLEETERLLCVPSVKQKLTSTPGKLLWIRGAINSTKSALNEIGRWVDRVRADKEGYGSVSWENRVRWVFNDYDKLVNRRMELGTSHQALSTVLSYLAPLEQTETSVDAAPPQYDDASFFDDFLSPRQRRKKARSMEKTFGVDKEHDGTLNEEICQPTQAPSFLSHTSQPIEPNEVGSGRDARTLGNATLSETLNSPYNPSTWSPKAVPPSVTSPTPSWAVASSIGHDQKTNVPVSSASSSSLSIMAPSQSTLKTQQTDNKTLQRPLDASSNWIFPETFSFDNPPPAYQPPTSQAPQFLESTNTYISNISTQKTVSRQHISSSVSPVLCPTSQQQLGATNFLGPIDPFELFVESHAQPGSICSQEVRSAVVESFLPVQKQTSPLSPPVPPKTCHSFPQADNIAEMMGNLSIHRSRYHSSLAETPEKVSIAQTPLINSLNEIQAAVPSWQDIPTSPSRMAGNTITNKYATFSASAIEVPAEPYYAIERSQNPPPQLGVDAYTSIYAQVPSHAISQVPQPHQQCLPSIQPQYQSQHQQYRSQIPIPVSHMRFLPLASATVPSPISWQEQQQKHEETDQTPVSPPTQEANVAHTVASAAELGYLIPRSLTLGESRRRNQKALLDLMERESYR